MSAADDTVAVDPGALASTATGIEEVASWLAAGRVNLMLFLPASDAVASALSDFEFAEAVACDAIGRECTVAASALRQVVREVSAADQFGVIM